MQNNKMASVGRQPHDPDKKCVSNLNTLLTQSVRVMARLQEEFQSRIVPALKQQLGRENAHALPRLEKVVVSMGVGTAIQDRKHLDEAVQHLQQLLRPKTPNLPLEAGGVFVPASRRDGNRLPGNAAGPADV